MVVQSACMLDLSRLSESPLVALSLFLSLVSAAAVCLIGWRAESVADRLSWRRMLRVRLLLAISGTGTLLSVCFTSLEVRESVHAWLLPLSLLLLVLCSGALTAAASYAGLLEPRADEQELLDDEYPPFHSGMPEQYSDLNLFTSPDDRIRVVHSHAPCLLGYTRQDLLERPMAALVAPNCREAYESCRELLRSGIPQQLHMQLLSKDGETIRFYTTLLPRIRRGRFQGVHSLGMSMSAEQQERELRMEADKLAALARMAAGIAHEIRNPLTVVKGLVQYNRHRVGMQIHYDLLIGEILQIEAIIEDFMMLSSSEPGVRERLNFGELVCAAVPERGGGRGWRFLNRCVDAVAWVYADGVRLQRALGRLMQELQEHVASEVEPLLLLWRQDNDVCLRLSCPGHMWNVAASPAFRAGELYYDTTSSGTGLAYMIAYHILTDHGGSMQLCSSDEDGEAIEIRLRAEWTSRSVAL
ncbi:hypothetical protein PA598K_01640 [Paenibacillus sp. 598K]|uniref:histidine kinase dimerization/phospho-acceptor domain-containing protein n=1 Tax=Paenibacillus sp. 598K TaxID=1117987 RepID=UPI000FF993FC|nr:histidine kinase dimerization/phospho-acceptor domain-containing protein [Paenibacillus sp. 598K]GBF73353.1 hypothetical protein PA598K_01640 [Paenibacillus sp. 598K]